MSQIGATRRWTFWRRASCFLSSVAFAITLLGCWPAFAQQSQPFHKITTASTNSTSVKGSAGQVVSIVAGNPGGTGAVLKFYDNAGAPTCNTATVAFTVLIPGQTSSAGYGNVIVEPPQAVSFLNGIGICVTGAVADNDNSNAPANVVIDIFYK